MTRIPVRRRISVRALVWVTALLAPVVMAPRPTAQAPASPAARRPLTVDDYTKWKSITDSAISGDGAWVTYVLQTTNVPTEQARPVMHLVRVQPGGQPSSPQSTSDIVVPNATGGTFSPDSKWLAYQVRSGTGSSGSWRPRRDAGSCTLICGTRCACHAGRP